jgi:hypothetical protein
MVEATARGEGQREDPGDRRIEVEVEHLHGTIANATVRSAVYVEYLQLVHTPRLEDRQRLVGQRDAQPGPIASSTSDTTVRDAGKGAAACWRSAPSFPCW